jgi:hypothetical protein
VAAGSNVLFLVVIPEIIAGEHPLTAFMKMAPRPDKAPTS